MILKDALYPEVLKDDCLIVAKKSRSAKTKGGVLVQ